MNFDDALSDHFDWKLRFRLAIANKNTVDVATISKDNCCELGKWLNGEASTRYHQLASYADCKAQHKAFHVEAGKVAAAINAKEYAEAEAMIDAGTAYNDASIATGLAIKKLKHEYELHNSSH